MGKCIKYHLAMPGETRSPHLSYHKRIKGSVPEPYVQLSLHMALQ